MKRKALALAVLLLIVVAGCAGNKYGEEKTLLTSITKAMETLNTSMNSAQTPQEVAGILGAFTGQIESLAPKMKAMTQNHPEWQNNPPKQLKETLDKFKTASTAFRNQAVPKIMQMMQANADNPELQSAVQKFASVMSQL